MSQEKSAYTIHVFQYNGTWKSSQRNSAPPIWHSTLYKSFLRRIVLILNFNQLLNPSWEICCNRTVRLEIKLIVWTPVWNSCFGRSILKGKHYQNYFHCCQTSATPTPTTAQIDSQFSFEAWHVSIARETAANTESYISQKQSKEESFQKFITKHALQTTKIVINCDC